ncbi:uncharacterized protein BO66DRAFT_420893 [Aspergillus aculeatinus CBS 121060]|uniref:Uncharacterized protein n=1 Tax=Aspergillus aculeatinus CBS 121060 TaxID=1448322 RepID=A0ACD1H7D6_9EURO|nr:hypothetical protein BO66DRAFT_420893 [Aspergillus aculeatinus CBS 121060]RAH69402.1 hypothetical protein BO66DRAFT_420893 [Aspergillus aculeatinus CBS 121060]
MFYRWFTQAEIGIEPTIQLNETRTVLEACDGHVSQLIQARETQRTHLHPTPPSLRASWTPRLQARESRHLIVAFEHGTELLSRDHASKLRSGTCDNLCSGNEGPHPHRLALEAQLHREWLATRTPEQLSGQPDWVIQKYFGDDPQRPDRSITKTVVGIPFPCTSEYRVSQMREAAEKVVGLHHETARGPQTKVIYMGWNKAAVGKAAKGHAAKEKKEIEAAERKRETDRAKLHADYRRKSREAPSPVGSYIVDCEEIKDQWPEDADGLTLDIHETATPGVFEAGFYFGALEGAMIICADEGVLERYCAELEREEDDDSQEEGLIDGNSDDSGVEGDGSPKLGVKRKVPVSQSGRSTKKSKQSPSRLYFLKLLGCETGEGEIFNEPDDGSIKFRDGNFDSFEGQANMTFIGDGIAFTGRKVSDLPGSSGGVWDEYSWRHHENARIGRWH